MSKEDDNVLGGITFFEKTDKNYKIEYESGECAQLTILNNHVLRYYMSPTGIFQDYPTPNNSNNVAKINAKKVTDYGTDAFDKSYVKDSEHRFIVHTEDIKITFDKIKGTFYVHDKRLGKDVLNEHEPISYNDVKTTQKLLEHRVEYFFGGGMQNGRFTHKGEIIHIENTNDWVDGGVTSPSPFYWSSYGYGVLRNTWQSGIYNFGSDNPGIIEMMHNESQFDAFYFINPRPRQILGDYYELTGQPIFMPEYAFYEAHLNTFNRDYWVEVDPSVHGAVKFEDGIFYKSYQPNQMEDKKGILESLNGENNNYQFSARAMIDRYKTNDMPLGWFIPNDGYGSGYGQTDSLKGDIENLKQFIEYANKNGVEVALWTESNLEPKDPNNPKKGERDLSKEVGIGAVALKCDVAWIGDGYSFALNAVERATCIFEDRANKQVRPLIIMVDGWAGTQRYSGIWSGDQTGGKWEYIRFHIPTYIGAGLSGIPVVGSDMDGIYGGGDREVNVRDFQWKTFTPLQLNMDGWGNLPKTPFSFDHEAIAIKRAYLKLKAMLLPYNYTIANESIHGLPMVRAMFLEFPNDTLTYTKDCQYQFMWGPSFLVAPVYQKTTLVDDNEVKREVRSGIYLPDPTQVWIDLFTGQKYQGGKVYNTLQMPLWKIPVFVRDCAIIPFVNNNNNPNEIKRNCRIITFYPSGRQNFKIYEDDGKSAEYLTGHHATTEVTSVRTNPAENSDLHIHIHKTKGHYKKIIKERKTLLQIMTSLKIDHVKAAINDKPIEIEKALSEQEFLNIKSNAYFFNGEFLINPYLRKCESEKELFQKCLLIKIESTDITETEIAVKIGLHMNADVKAKIIGNIEDLNSNRQHPDNFQEKETSPSSVTVQWDEDKEAIYYEIERDGVIFTTIKGGVFVFEGFQYETEHTLRIRSVFNDGVSKWSPYRTVQTKPNPFKNTVKGVTVTCNVPCQPSQEACKLAECNMKSLWHTHWGMPGQADYKNGKMITLSFDLGDVYDIERIDYIPREDAGNGTFLKVIYRYSVDGKHWSDWSSIIRWEQDDTTKSIMVKEGRMQLLEMNILESVGGFGSGRNVMFFKKIF